MIFQRISCHVALCCMLLFSLDIQTHGFAENTRIAMIGYNSFVSIRQLVCAVKDNRTRYVRAYDRSTRKFVDKRIRAVGESETNCYCILAFDGDQSHDIVCTPSQQFYRISDGRWVEAYLLREGDCLLSDYNQSVELKAMQLIIKPLKVYAIEVKESHTFLVGFHRIVTHNMFVPIAASLGINVPFSIGCGGASIGAIFGPIGIVGGVVLGGVIGCILGARFKERFSEYTLSFTVDAIESCVYKNKEESVDKDKGAEAQAPGKSIENNKGGSKEENLPKGGSFPFIPPKTKGGKIPKDKTGAYIDDKGNQWKWDSRKNEWDVSNKWGHRNVNSQGYETHRGTHPQSGSDTSKSKKNR